MCDFTGETDLNPLGSYDIFLSLSITNSIESTHRSFKILICHIKFSPSFNSQLFLVMKQLINSRVNLKTGKNTKHLQ